MPVFDSLEFDFALTAGVEFDVEVAKELAEQLAQRDGGRYNHSHANRFQRVHVGLEGLSEPLPDEDELGYSTNLLLPAHATEDPNPVFARHFQQALDERENSNRMNIPATIGVFALTAAIPGGASAAILAEKGLTTKEALISAGLGVGFNVVAVGGFHSVRNIYRRIVTDEGNSRLRQIRVDRAADFAQKLDLPPVIYKS